MVVLAEEAICLPEAKKIVVVGAAKCGKSCFVKRATEGQFEPRYLQTFGADLTVIPSMNASQYTLHVWNCSGHERYKVLVQKFMIDANLIVVCFDLKSQASFKALDYWLKLVKKHSNDAAVVIVGTHADEVDSIQVRNEEITKLSKVWGATNTSISSKTGDGVARLMEHIHSLLVSKE